jgi:hypothetical protein
LLSLFDSYAFFERCDGYEKVLLIFFSQSVLARA